jgi:hypothetical protein
MAERIQMDSPDSPVTQPERSHRHARLPSAFSTADGCGETSGSLLGGLLHSGSAEPKGYAFPHFE